MLYVLLVRDWGRDEPDTKQRRIVKGTYQICIDV